MENKNYDLLNDNLELEMKIQVDDINVIFDWLENNGEYLGKTSQIDYYYEPINNPFIFTDATGFLDANDWLRVRISAKGCSICFKRCHRNEQNIALYSDEIETKIDDAEKMKKILVELGYQEILKLKKERKSYKYNTYRFDIDEIVGLGCFIEIEDQGQISDLLEGRQRIRDTLKKIGITNYKEVNTAYPQMIWNNKIPYIE